MTREDPRTTLQDHRMTLDERASYVHKEFFFEKGIFFMIFGPFQVYDFMILHF